MSVPNADDVSAFRGVTDADGAVAVLWLRRYPDVGAAIGNYFDLGGVLPPDLTNTWDESVFHADRDLLHGPENRPQSTFNVQGADALNPNVFDTTPSRPPSRVSTYADREEYGMQQAISMSIDQRMDGQETGVMNAAGQRFRRVEGAYHDTKNWALTLPQFNARELSQGPGPKERVRKKGAPASLKPSPASQNLPALVTILHNIPMAREALLARDLSVPDYGNNADWWDGDQIQSTRVFVADEPEDTSDYSPLIQEAQRLMAFLEMTERAYGSADNLMRESGHFNEFNGLAANFLGAWRQVMIDSSSGSPLKDTFTTTAYNDQREVANGSDAEVKLFELLLQVKQRTIDAGGSLYDAIDEMIWIETDGFDPLYDVYLECGDILTFRVQNRMQSASGLGLDIPAEFYPDRYLESFIDLMGPVRSKRIDLLVQLARIEDQLSRLAVLDDPSQATITHSGIWLLEQAADYFASDRDRSSTMQRPSDVDMLVEIDDEEAAFTYGQVEDELRAVVVQLGKKHHELMERKQRINSELRALSAVYREPQTHSDPPQHPLHRYTLRGIGMRDGTTYVLANPLKAEDLLDAAMDDRWQWWKLGFSDAASAASASATTPEPVTAEPVSEAETLAAAKSADGEVLLVYASDAAVNFPSLPLPQRLRNFVRLDNLAFSRELEQTERGAGAGVGVAGGPPLSLSSSSSSSSETALCREVSSIEDDAEGPPPLQHPHLPPAAWSDTDEDNAISINVSSDDEIPDAVVDDEDDAKQQHQQASADGGPRADSPAADEQLIDLLEPDEPLPPGAVKFPAPAVEADAPSIEEHKGG